MWSYNYGYLCHGMNDYLEHHGILGQKWGIRRFQNPDGSLTPAGRKRYGAASDSTDSITTDKGTRRIMSDLSKGITKYQNEQERYSNKYFNTPFKTLKDRYSKKTAEADEERKAIANQYFKYQEDLIKGKHGNTPIKVSKEDLKKLKDLNKKYLKSEQKVNKAEYDESLGPDDFDKIYEDFQKSIDNVTNYAKKLVNEKHNIKDSSAYKYNDPLWMADFIKVLRDCGHY